jgi:hypothetical protein
MAPPKGNRFWEKRSKHGRDKIMADPDVMWKAACEYFKWAEDTPLWESKVTQFQGAPVDMVVPKMRAMTIEGLCLFLDINKTTWYDYCKRDDFINITKRIDDVIRSQKFAGAAADLLNANIIARDLGLSDKKELEVKDETLSDADRIERIVTLLDKARAKRAEQPD